MAVLDQLRSHIGEHAVRVAMRAADEAVSRTIAEESRRTGAMAAATHHTLPVLNSDRVTCEIRVDTDYAKYQDDGTGVYGPGGQRIYPRKPGGVLVFDWPAAGGVVFARSVAGAPGRHFFAEKMPMRWAESLADSIGGPL